MAKKITAVILSLLVLLLVGCGKESSATNESNSLHSSQTESIGADAETVSETEKQTEVPTEAPTEPPTEAPTIDVDWKEVSYVWEDSEGYSFDVSIRLSPWILLSNTDIVKSVWSEVNPNITLPSFNDWGLSLYNGNGFNNLYTRNDNNVQFFHSMTDMYYCIGYATIENTTEGWDINKSNPRNISEGLSCSIDINDVNGGGSSIICKTFYQDGYKDYGNLKIDGAIMKNHVTIPFILMTPEIFSPKYPNGEYYDTILAGKFTEIVSKNEIRIGIIGKDKEYVAP